MKNAQQLINDHIKSQEQDLVKLAKKRKEPILSVLKQKHHYMGRCLKLFYLSLYAVKYNDGTDAKLANRSKWRKQFYINKLTS